MLKHRVSNAGAHGPPPIIHRPAPPPPTTNPRAGPAKVPKPPRINPDSIQHMLPGNVDVCDSGSVPHSVDNANQYTVPVQGNVSNAGNVNIYNTNASVVDANGQAQAYVSQPPNVQYSQPPVNQGQADVQGYVQQQQHQQYQQQKEAYPIPTHGQTVQQYQQQQQQQAYPPPPQVQNVQQYHHQQQDEYDDQPYYPPPPPPISEQTEHPATVTAQPTYQPPINYEHSQSNYQTAYNQSQNQLRQSPVHNSQDYQQVQGHNTQSYAQSQTHNESPYRTPVQNGGVPLPIPTIQTDTDNGEMSEKDKAKEGIRVINEKYDSIGNLNISPQRSPMVSPTADMAPLSLTDILMSQKFREGVLEQDLLQVDTFYRGHKTEVHVCNCLANMYVGNVKTLQSTDEQWNFMATGIPLLLLDTGEHHRTRKLFIILAEKGTGFTLWRDVIDNLSNYKTPNPNFHTMHTSKDHTKLAGLSFDEADKAREFYSFLEKLTSDPTDDLLKIGKTKKKKSVKEKKKKLKLPKKTEISQPCCFVHVTKLERPGGETEDAGTPDDKLSQDANGISKPFNFQHVTATNSNGSALIPKSESLSNVMGSKLTLTSTSSVDSGLSDDRSTRTANS